MLLFAKYPCPWGQAQTWEEHFKFISLMGESTSLDEWHSPPK